MMQKIAPSLRPVTAADEAFLFAVYTSVRKDEFAGLGFDDSQRELFLRMQFTAQRGAYQQAFPGSEHSVVLSGNEPAGVLRVNRTPAELRVVDIALLGQYRSARLGTRLIQQLQSEAKATQRPLVLRVLKTNRAAELYSRLGFCVVADEDPYLALSWSDCVAADRR